jgi:hypothetical protein
MAMKARTDRVEPTAFVLRRIGLNALGSIVCCGVAGDIAAKESRRLVAKARHDGLSGTACVKARLEARLIRWADKVGASRHVCNTLTPYF